MTYAVDDVHSNRTNLPYTIEKRKLKSLWRAVLAQAITDAASGSRKAYDIRNKIKAIQWLNDCNDDFKEVCHLAGFDVEYVLQKAKAALADGCIWRKDIRLVRRYDKAKVNLANN